MNTKEGIFEEEIWKSSTVAVRFNAQQLGLIFSGLNRIALAYTTYTNTGSADGYPFRVHPLAIRHRPGEDPGTFNSDLMQIIIELWTKLKGFRRKRTRVMLNFIQVSACVLSVRIGKDYERLRLLRKPSREQKRARQRMISTLERELKRARRAYAAEMGESNYQRMRGTWLGHLRWVRMNLVYFRPVRITTQRRLAQRLLIGYCCERAKAGIVKRKLVSPEDRALRRLVRLAVRYIRRGRIRLCVQQLINNPRFAEEFLAGFINARIELTPIEKHQQDKEEQL